MPRDVTVTLEDGIQHIYKGVPDTATPDDVEKRAASEFRGKKVIKIDGGAKATQEAPMEKPSFLGSVAETVNAVAPLMGPMGAIMAIGKKGMDLGNQFLEDVSGSAGEKVTDVAHSAGASPEVSGALGAATKAGIQVGVPSLVGGVAGLVTKGAEAVSKAAPNALQTAERIVREKGIDWSSLSRAARLRLKELVKDSDNLSNLDKAGIERVVKAGNLDKPIKLTKGQATREPGQLRVEEQLAQTETGKPIREVHMEQNQTLQDNLDILRGKTGGRAADAEATGATVDRALKKKIAKSESNVNRLYNKARAAGELESTIDLQPLAEHFNKNPGTNEYAVSQLKNMKLFKEDEFGNLVPTHNITLNELEKVRQQASKVARTSTDGTTAHDAGELMKQIDSVIPETAGGDAYKAARAARKQHAMEFEEPKAIAQIVGQKSKTDRVTALESVWDKTVLSKASSIADLTKVRDTLLKSTDRATRDEGRKAWKDMVGQTVAYIKKEAVSGPKDQNGVENLSPAKLKAAIERIGDKKLEVLLGKSQLAKLKEISEVAQDVKTMPPYKGGSTTTANALTLLDRVLEKAKHAPIGDYGRGAVRVLSDLKAKGAEEGKVAEALGNNRIPRTGYDTLKEALKRNQPAFGAAAGAASGYQNDAR